MVKTLDERYAESERQPTKQAPCETEAEYRKAAETGAQRLRRLDPDAPDPAGFLVDGGDARGLAAARAARTYVGSNAELDRIFI